jgi:hypothetical protein
MDFYLIGFLVLTHLAAFVGGMFAHHWFTTKAQPAATAAVAAVKTAV